MTTSPGQQPGPFPPRPTAPSGKPPWPRRHPVWSAVIALCAVLVIIGVATNGSGSRNVGSSSPAPSQQPSAKPSADPSAAAAVVAPTLSCAARALRPRPADHTIARVRVSTAAHAWVTAAGPLPLVRGEHATGRANTGGTRMLRFRVGDAQPGVAVVITVRVARHGRSGNCRASLRPRPPAITATPAPTATTSPAGAPQPTTEPAPPQPTAASCHPLSDEGTCYEPGEFCRDDDHGMTGLAGDGETIVCEDNDGWRWEPV